jgi:hypothetical protein
MKHYRENLRLTALETLRRGRMEQIRFWRRQLGRDQERMRRFLLGERAAAGAAAP